MQVEACLREHPDGVSEHVLIKLLRAREDCALPEGSLSDPLNLFRVHFLLFHVLYLLRDVFRDQQAFNLRIHPLLIQLEDYLPGDAGMVREDPLRAYYLDLDQLATATAESVDEMLRNAHRALVTDDDRNAALRALGLDADASQAKVRRRYRELAMEHHPDRGGDAGIFRRIREAMEKLGGRRRP